LTKLNLEAEFVSHPDSLARLPIDPAMENSFGSYSEPGTRNNYEAETSNGGGVKAWEATLVGLCFIP